MRFNVLISQPALEVLVVVECIFTKITDNQYFHLILLHCRIGDNVLSYPTVCKLKWALSPPATALKCCLHVHALTKKEHINYILVSGLLLVSTVVLNVGIAADFVTFG